MHLNIIAENRIVNETIRMIVFTIFIVVLAFISINFDFANKCKGENYAGRLTKIWWDYSNVSSNSKLLILCSLFQFKWDLELFYEMDWIKSHQNRSGKLDLMRLFWSSGSENQGRYHLIYLHKSIMNTKPTICRLVRHCCSLNKIEWDDLHY